MAEKENELSTELTEAEKLKIEQEVRRELAKELKAAEAEKFREAARDRIRAETMFKLGKDDKGQDTATIQFYLASYPKYCIIDGQVYHSGKTYTKRLGVVQVLADQMWRSLQQEERRRGERMDFEYVVPQYRKTLTKDGLKLTPM